MDDKPALAKDVKTATPALLSLSTEGQVYALSFADHVKRKLDPSKMALYSRTGTLTLHFMVNQHKNVWPAQYPRWPWKVESSTLSKPAIYYRYLSSPLTFISFLYMSPRSDGLCSFSSFIWTDVCQRISPAAAD